MTCAENLAAFVCRSGYEDLSDTAREQLKVRILDSLGCALGAFVRYLDFNDAYLATAETHHPSDNLTAILAATECGDVSSRELMTALTVAYEVQWRLSDVAPVRDKGFDHTTQGFYSVASGVSKVLGLDEIRTANAIAICGTAFNALRVTRTGQLSHRKGLAFPNTAACSDSPPPREYAGKHQQLVQVSARWEHSLLKERAR